MQEQVDRSLSGFNQNTGLDLGLKQFLPSTLGRTLARALECELCADTMLDDWNQLVNNIKNGDSSTANVEKWDPSKLAKRGAGRGYQRSTAWCAGSLDQDQRRQDRKLSGDCTDHLERLSA